MPVKNFMLGGRERIWWASFPCPFAQSLCVDSKHFEVNDQGGKRDRTRCRFSYGGAAAFAWIQDSPDYNTLITLPADALEA